MGSGACLLVPARRFREVGGFWEAMFLYCEDTDLCWRLRLAGLRIVVCPDARVVHDYDFGRNTSKLFHLERNRLLMLAANYEPATLARIAPALVATELALLAVAVRGGWLPQKLRAVASAAVRSRLCASSGAPSHCCGGFPTAPSRVISNDGSVPNSAKRSRPQRAALEAYARLARLA